MGAGPLDVVDEPLGEDVDDDDAQQVVVGSPEGSSETQHRIPGQFHLAMLDIEVDRRKIEAALGQSGGELEIVAVGLVLEIGVVDDHDLAVAPVDAEHLVALAIDVSELRNGRLLDHEGLEIEERLVLGRLIAGCKVPQVLPFRHDLDVRGEGLEGLGKKVAGMTRGFMDDDPVLGVHQEAIQIKGNLPDDQKGDRDTSEETSE